MRHVLRELRRAPARILTSILALALAIGAIGVLAIPTVSTSSLRDAADRDGVADIVLGTTDTKGLDQRAVLAGVDNVERVEGQILTTAATEDGRLLTLLGTAVDDQQLDVLRLDAGRPPAAVGELVLTEPSAAIGSTFPLELAHGGTIDATVVGHGTTSYWAEEHLAFTTLETAALVGDVEGTNRLVVRATDTGQNALRATANEIRDALAAEDVSMTFLPYVIPDRRHPIEADIEQISSLIGLLGLVAGLVALVLLGSTTNTLITERTREVAVMRALGARPRPLRRRLRRLAMGIALASVVIGLPLGILVANLIARLVLQEFVGMTPGVAVSIPVLVGSAAFALIGARLVAARAARRVVRAPLAEALRDRDAAPFGRRLTERIAARVRTGGLLDRTALRNGVHRRSRSLAIVAQLTAAVAALMVITSIATTVNAYNTATLDPWRWASWTERPGPGLDIDAAVAADDPRSEVAIETGGEVDGWDVGVFGFDADTAIVDRTVDAGSWLSAPEDAVVSTGFAEHVGIEPGDRIEVLLATGPHTFTVSGLHPDRDRSVFVEREALAGALGRPDAGNALVSLDARPATALEGFVHVEYLDDLRGDDDGRQAIVLIFGAIGLVVVSVAGLAVASAMAVGVYERRHEFGAVQAIGGRRRHVFRIVSAELLPLAGVGIGVGLVAGWYGGAAIAASFEQSNAVEIGFVYAAGAVPFVIGAVLGGSIVLSGLVVRRVTRRSAAVTLRSAT